MQELSEILQAIERGEEGSSERLLPLVYGELRKLAAAKMSREPSNHTLQPTALVHEAWLRLTNQGGTQWQGRGHFFGAAAEAMRRILIEDARHRSRLKPGKGRHGVSMRRASLLAGTVLERDPKGRTRGPKGSIVPALARSD